MSDEQFYIFILAMALFVLILIMPSDKSLLESVKNEDNTLYCNITDVYQAVDKNKVVDFVDGTWVFTNGYAKNCYVRDK